MNTHMIRKLAFILILITSLNMPAFADCKDAYSAGVKRLDGMLNPARTTMITAAASGAAIPIAVAATTGVFVASSLVSFPAAVVSAGTYFFIVQERKHSLEKVIQLLKNTDKGTGPLLAKVERKVHRTYSDAKHEQIVAAIKQLNQNNSLCTENDLGKPSLKGFQAVVLAVKKEISKDFPEVNDNIEEDNE